MVQRRGFQIYCENCALNRFLLNTDGSYMHPSYKADNSLIFGRNLRRYLVFGVIPLSFERIKNKCQNGFILYKYDEAK